MGPPCHPGPRACSAAAPSQITVISVMAGAGRGTRAGLVQACANGSMWRPFGTAVSLSGSQSQPITSWAPTTGFGGMVCFSADAAKALFDLDLAEVHDRFLCARDALGPQWQPLLDDLICTADDI